MRFVLAIVLTLAACVKERAPNQWNGIPDADRASSACQWDRDGKIGACIAKGKAYQCVSIREDNETHFWYRNECARVSALPTAEEPPAND